MEGIGTTAGAALISERTGRACSAQNLGQIVRRGRLPDSTISLKPIRLNPATLLGEYVSKVDARQSLASNPGPGKQKEPDRQRPSRSSADEIPDYNDSRARSEFEKANLLELDRKAKEALLLPADQVEKVWANAVTIARTKLLAIPTRARQRIPHLSLEEVAIVEELIRETLEGLSGGE